MGLATIGGALGASAANATAVGAAALSTATAVASTAANFVSQSNAAEAQAAAQQQRNEMITEATIENYKELSKAEQATLYNAQQDSLENKIGAMEAMSQQEAMASATGVRGRSSDMIFNQMSQDKASNDTAIKMARDQQLYNINQQALSLQRGAEASYDNTPIRKPSAWQAVAAGASDGAQMFGSSMAFDKAWRDSSKVGG